MTYAASEVSKHSGKPVELFKFEGTYANHFYTSGPEMVTYGGDDYLPLTLRRSTVQVTTTADDNSEVTVELPVGAEIIAIYGFQIAPPELRLTIYRGHNPGEFVRFWGGNVENINVGKGVATIRIPSTLAAALSADFPNVFFQTPCNHDLFDARCKVVYEDWSLATTVASVDGREVTVSSIGTLDGDLVGGEAVLASGERRMIISQVGTLLTVNYPFAQVAATDAVTISAGCDLAFRGDCATRFDNQINFGGFPFIPPSNVFSKGLEPGKDVADTACLPTFADWSYRIRIQLTSGQPGFEPAWTGYAGASGFGAIAFMSFNQDVTVGAVTKLASTSFGGIIPSGDIFVSGEKFMQWEIVYKELAYLYFFFPMAPGLATDLFETQWGTDAFPETMGDDSAVDVHGQVPGGSWDLLASAKPVGNTFLWEIGPIALG